MLKQTLGRDCDKSGEKGSSSLLDYFLIEYFLLFHRFLLLHRQSPEKLNLLLIRWLPLIVNLECRFKVLFYLDVERLRLHVNEWRIVNSWDCLGGYQMM